MNAQRPRVLQMEHSEFVKAGTCGVTGFFDAFHNKFYRGRGEVMIQRVFVLELTSHTAYLQIRSMLNYCRERFTEGIGYEILVDNFVLVEVYWLVWGDSVFFLPVIVSMSFQMSPGS